MGSSAVTLAAVFCVVAAAALATLLLLTSRAPKPPKPPQPPPKPPQPPPKPPQPPPKPPQPPKTPQAPKGPGGGQQWTVQATYYGPDKIHGIRGGNDNIFQHIPAGQYTASQLRQIGKHFCAMTEKFLRKGFMGKILRIRGSKATMDFVVVDLLPDRNDGKGVEIDIHDQADWLKLGGDEAVGIQTVTFSVVGTASIPVPGNSPWDPKKFGF
jgi:hypothetical protein